MSGKAPATTSSSAAWKVGLGVFVVLAVIAWAGGTGRIDLDREDDDDHVRATFEVMWGEIRDTGETFPGTNDPVSELVCAQRLLVITIYVDDLAYDMDQLESESSTPCIFLHNRSVPRFSRLRMSVEEATDVGGWKLCMIRTGGSMVLPYGIDNRQPGEGRCEVWGIAT